MLWYAGRGILPRPLPKCYGMQKGVSYLAHSLNVILIDIKEKYIWNILQTGVNLQGTFLTNFISLCLPWLKYRLRTSQTIIGTGTQSQAHSYIHTNTGTKPQPHSYKHTATVTQLQVHSHSHRHRHTATGAQAGRHTHLWVHVHVHVWWCSHTFACVYLWVRVFVFHIEGYTRTYCVTNL